MNSKKTRLIKSTKTIETIELFDEFLQKREAKFTAVIVGRGALTMLGLNVLDPEHIELFGPILSTEQEKLIAEFRSEKWIENVPELKSDAFPPDWNKRTKLIFSGKALRVYTLGNLELLKWQLWEHCDRADEDRSDIVEMKPKVEQLQKCLSWVQQRDPSPDWQDHVKSEFSKISKDLGFGA